jgi:hypothetical protein
MPEGNPLEEYFRNNDRRLIHKWMHYFEIYHRHFDRFRHRPITVLEFGVSQGGSLQMWREYFGEDAMIYGVDIDPACAELTGPNIEVLIGDQEDRDFLRTVADKVGPIDLLIEDGGHTMGQQIATFEVLYPHVKEDGVFLIEDLHTSYWPRFGGGYRRPGTFIEYAKGLTDQLNAWHSREESFAVDDFTRTTKSMHFYDSIIVFEKGAVPPPRHEKTGQATIQKAKGGRGGLRQPGA